MYESGLCPGAANIQCCQLPSCTSVSGDTQRDGVCRDESTCVGSSVGGLCPGGASIKCCLPDVCSVNGIQGTCIDESECTGDNAQTTSGLCSGGNSIKCCTTGSPQSTNAPTSAPSSEPTRAADPENGSGDINVDPDSNGGNQADDDCTLGTATGCSTYIANGLTLQLIAKLNSMENGVTFSSIENENVRCSGACTPWLQSPAATKLIAATEEKGDFITINSGYRSSAQQYLLYRWYLNSNQCGIQLAARPGTSNHEGGLAIDTSYYNYWKPALENNGWDWHGAGDPVHFDFEGAGRVSGISQESLRAFQTLWNENNPTDQITADGVYGANTASRFGQAPCNGWDTGDNTVSCPAGKYSNGSGVCVSCPENTYASGTGTRTSCTSCGDNKVSPVNSVDASACVVPGTAVVDCTVSGQTGICKPNGACDPTSDVLWASSSCESVSVGYGCCADMQSCRAGGKEGVCKSTNLCEGTTTSGLCSGPNDIKCCTAKESDADKEGTSCTASNQAGACATTSSCDTNTHQPWDSSECHTSSESLSCCVPQQSCTVDGDVGSCKSTSQCGGTSTSGLCRGPANIQCCTFPVPDGDSTCWYGDYTYENCCKNGYKESCWGFGYAPAQCCEPGDNGIPAPADGGDPFVPPEPSVSDGAQSCTTPYGGYHGKCMHYNDCTGGTVNGLCAGSSSIKCCVSETVPAHPEFAYIGLEDFLLLFDGISHLRGRAMWPYFNEALSYADINTCNRISAFVAQIGHESAGLRYFEEIASGEAYEGRASLGNTEPGDGKRYKGRGPIQLTGRSNYRKAGARLGLNFEEDPELAVFPSGGFKAAADYWKNHWSGNLNQYCDSGTDADFRTLTLRINGGTNGLAGRSAKWEVAKTKLGCPTESDTRSTSPLEAGVSPPSVEAKSADPMSETTVVESEQGTFEVVHVLSVQPRGTPPFQFQWYIDGVPVAGNDTDTSSLVLTDERAEATGTYSVVIKNAAGMIEVVVREGTTDEGDDGKGDTESEGFGKYYELIKYVIAGLMAFAIFGIILALLARACGCRGKEHKKKGRRKMQKETELHDRHGGMREKQFSSALTLKSEFSDSSFV